MNSDAYSALLPPITPLNQPYWDGCAQGELRLQSCDDCGTFRFPDAPTCPSCLSNAVTWKTTSGTGQLWSWIRIHQRYIAAYADETPYVVAFIRLAEGPYMISHLTDEPPASWLDRAVRAVFEPDAAGRALLKFTIAPD